MFDVSEKNTIFRMKAVAMNVATRIIKQFNLMGSVKPMDFSKIVISGGCFVSWYNDKSPRDIDIFILDDEDTKKTFGEYLEFIKDKSIINRAIINDKSDYIKNPNIEKVVEEVRSLDNIKYQYIFTKYKTRRELIDHFDFVHTTISYDVGEGKIYLTKGAFDAIVGKRLVVNKDNKPQQWRVEKFLNDGWVVPGSLMKR